MYSKHDINKLVRYFRNCGGLDAHYRKLLSRLNIRCNCGCRYSYIGYVYTPWDETYISVACRRCSHYRSIKS